MSDIGACGNCEFSTESISVCGVESKAGLTAEGNILYAGISPCGISISKIGRDELESDYPNLLKRIDECEGPVEEVREVPRRWPLGAFGLVKEVTVERCGATTSLELYEVVRTSQSKTGVS